MGILGHPRPREHPASADCKDRYARTIGDVYVGETFVNEKMVGDGWAWNYVRYSKSQRLADLERQARAARRGLGAGDSPVAPWAYRAEKARKQRLEALFQDMIEARMEDEGQ